MEWIEKFFAGDRVALARIISVAENGNSAAEPMLNQVLKKVRGAHRIGITGPPGAGKSTLVDNLVQHYRKQGKSVGVIAVDPTSPFSGGALLGDRVRMQSAQGDPNVFIRSMATRGSLGGLSNTSQDVADIMDAFGFDVILMETVGVGQSELDIMEATDTVIVVLVPESGDSIQAMKAGLMEIGNIFVLNKADHENADQAFMEISSVLQFNPEKEGWHLPLIKTVASQGKGIDELFIKIQKHYQFLKETKALQKKQRKRVASKLKSMIRNQVLEQFWTEEKQRRYNEAIEAVLKGELTYKDALEQIITG